MRTANVDEESIVEIVNIVSLQFASDEAAGLKVDILEPLFYSQSLSLFDLFVETSLPNQVDWHKQAEYECHSLSVNQQYCSK